MFLARMREMLPKAEIPTGILGCKTCFQCSERSPHHERPFGKWMASSSVLGTRNPRSAGAMRINNSSTTKGKIGPGYPEFPGIVGLFSYPSNCRIVILGFCILSFVVVFV